MKTNENEKYITELLCTYDPMKICDEKNQDEYEAEALIIAKEMQNAKSEDDVVLIIWKTFQDMFDVGLAGKKEKYTDIGREVWKLHNK